MAQYICPACGHSPMGMGEQFGTEIKGHIIVQCCRNIVHSWDYTEEGLAKARDESEALRIQAEAEAAEILRQEEINKKRRDALAKARAVRAAQLAEQAANEKKGEEA